MYIYNISIITNKKEKGDVNMKYEFIQRGTLEGKELDQFIEECRKQALYMEECIKNFKPYQSIEELELITSLDEIEL